MIYLTPRFLTQHEACSEAHRLESPSISFPSLSAETWAHLSLLLPVNWQPTPHTCTHTRAHTNKDTHTVSSYFSHFLPSLIFGIVFNTLLNPPPLSSYWNPVFSYKPSHEFLIPPSRFSIPAHLQFTFRWPGVFLVLLSWYTTPSPSVLH